MQLWPDYDLDNPSTWTVMQSPGPDSAFVDGLTRIGGVNIYGKPNLVCRWGATYVDPMSVDGGLKYWLSNKDAELSHFEFKCPVTGMTLQVKTLVEVPDAVLIPIPKYRQEQLGERRFIVEQWRSSEFLARSGRYTPESVYDAGESQEFFFCRNCGTELAQDIEGPRPCPKCGSKRHFVQTMQEAGGGQLLKTNPAEGCYDFFLRLENAAGGPMAPNENALHLIEQMWRRQNTQSRKEKITDMVAETERQMATNAAATSPTNPFTAPAVPGW